MRIKGDTKPLSWEIRRSTLKRTRKVRRNWSLKIGSIEKMFSLRSW